MTEVSMQNSMQNSRRATMAQQRGCNALTLALEHEEVIRSWRRLRRVLRGLRDFLHGLL